MKEIDATRQECLVVRDEISSRREQRDDSDAFAKRHGSFWNQLANGCVLDLDERR